MGLDAAKETDVSTCIIIVVKCAVTIQPLVIKALDCAVCTQHFAQVVVVTVNLHGNAWNACI